MDPLSAFSLAAGVVQFVDFTSRLLSDVIQIYQSSTGQSATTVELSKIAQDLRSYVNHIERKANSLSYITEDDTKDRILRICRDCSAVCHKLEEALKKLQATGKTRLEIAQSSLRVALKGLWADDEIDGLVRQLSSVRSNMMNAIIVSVWEDGKRGWADVRQLVEQQNDMFAILSRIDKTTVDFRQQLVDITSSSDVGMSKGNTQQTIVWTKIWSPRSGYQADASLDEDDSGLCESILNSLIFRALTQREDAIPEAYKETFRWVFDDPRLDDEGNAMWSHFPNWLQGDSESMYWVAGKPGSGKSTLLKYINNGSLKTHLNAWAGNRKLLLGAFYFWNAGTEEQKSHIGLLKTLLFECMSCMPELVRRVTPKRWAFRKIFNDPKDFINPPWSLAELQEALTVLASGAGDSYVMALVVDGLDEFSGDHRQLLAFLEAIRSYGRGQVKICTSSRPWNVFMDFFRNSPQLRLEVLTKMDIEHYIRSNFESHASFEELREAYEAESEHLIHSIVEKAHGVFLWISIVVRSLLESLTDGSSIPELQSIIDELPESLSDLYRKIFQSIPQKYMQDCSRFLQIKEHCSGPLTTEILWLADSEDALSTDLAHITPQQKKHMDLLMRRKIGSRTKGLLEVSREGIIDYLHLTTHEWVVENLPDITARGPEGFDVYVALFKAQAIRVKNAIWIGKGLLSRTNEIWKELQNCMEYASRISNYGQNQGLMHNVVRKLLESQEIEQLLNTLWWPRKPMVTGNVTITHPMLNADIILAAQFCIVDYVREKVALDPSVLNQKNDGISILESAIFGCSCSFSPPDAPGESSWGYVVSQQRVALVNFLLDNGADPRQPSIRGSLTIDHVKSPTFDILHLPDGRLYWNAIEELLEDTSYSSQKRIIPQTSRPKETGETEETEETEKTEKIEEISRLGFSRRIKRLFEVHNWRVQK
ncbi:hypothetical protein F4810DRAFT_684030 [Camillea tinctor]|nr:hypothetical protein F4810DRAFT_684030 [Camillea tinctor]